MTKTKDAKQPMNIEIQVDDLTSLGQYVNMVVAQHSHSEFLFDFIFLTPGQPKARVRSRIIMAPEHAKRLMMLLSDNISRYEQHFGKIKLPEPAMPAPKTMQ